MIEDISDQEGLDLYDLSMLGAIGWEVITAIPRTYSGSKSYVSKNKITAASWGGGSTVQRVSLSGNVVGAYLLMKLPITAATRASLDSIISSVLTTNVSERIGPRPA